MKTTNDEYIKERVEWILSVLPRGSKQQGAVFLRQITTSSNYSVSDVEQLQKELLDCCCDIVKVANVEDKHINSINTTLKFVREMIDDVFNNFKGK